MTYQKPIDVAEHKEQAEVEKKNLGNTLPGHAAAYADFASKDEEWHAYMTKKLLRKVDIRLLPVLICMYLLNFLDRSNLAQARLGTLEKDLGMKGTDFNVCTSILFVGYILMQLPSNMLLTRVKPSIYLAVVMTIWGAISAAQAGTKTYAQMVVCRFFLGVMEAPFFPGSIFLLSSWYKRSELAHRLAFFYAGSAVANMFGGLLAAGVLGNLDGAHGISGWRWLFIIEGVITIGVAMTAGVILPNYPATTKWLSEEERNYAQWRLLEDTNEEDDQMGATVMEGLKWAFKDYRLYLFILLQHLNLLTQSFTYFFPTIVKTLGYNKTQTLLLTVPVWFGTLLSTLIVTYSSSRLNERAYHIAGGMLVSCIGNIIVTSTLSVPGRFVGMFLMPMGALPAFQIILTWIANSFPRPLVKRSASIAACNMLGNLANIYGPYMYQSTQGPRYIPGGSATAVAALLTAVVAVIVRFVLVSENKKLEQAENEGVNSTIERGADVRAFGFRYIL